MKLSITLRTDDSDSDNWHDIPDWLPRQLRHEPEKIEIIFSLLVINQQARAVMWEDSLGVVGDGKYLCVMCVVGIPCRHSSLCMHLLLDYSLTLAS